MVQSTIRLGRYGWNTSKEGSLWRRKKNKNKVEVQLTILASLGSLASNDNPEFDKSARLAVLKATSHSTIFDIPMRPVREDQRHRRRFTR